MDPPSSTPTATNTTLDKPEEEQDDEDLLDRTTVVPNRSSNDNDNQNNTSRDDADYDEESPTRGFTSRGTPSTTTASTTTTPTSSPRRAASSSSSTATTPPAATTTTTRFVVPDDPPAAVVVSLEEAILACMPSTSSTDENDVDYTRKTSSSSSLAADQSQHGRYPKEQQQHQQQHDAAGYKLWQQQQQHHQDTDDSMAAAAAIPPAPLVRNSTPLQVAVLACMPGAYEISGPLRTSTTTTTTATTNTTTSSANQASPDYIESVYADDDEYEDVYYYNNNNNNNHSDSNDMDVERLSSSGGVTAAVTLMSSEYARDQVPSARQHQQQQAETAETTNIVSAYRVNDEEEAPIFIATPFKDNRLRIVLYGFLITSAVALMVGLSVGLTTKGKQVSSPSDPAVDRLVSEVLFEATDEGSFVQAQRYSRTENGTEIVTTTGRGVLNYCDVLPCNEGGCDVFNLGKVYKPGCCRGSTNDGCKSADRCGYLCPTRRNLCHPAFVGCKDASCFECERGPDGEELFQIRSTTFNVNCLRTGVAFGHNDLNDNVKRFYKWVIGCGYIVRGGNEWQNSAPGEYVCVAVRIGDGITKTLSQPSPCQIIQLGECGCGPADMHTFGLPAPKKPCRTKQDCRYLCDDAGEAQASTLCEAFPGIEWWEGKNRLGQSLFYEPKDQRFGNVTIEIDIYGE